jgi:hypothetical protein
MLPTGHFALSYLISQFKIKGKKLLVKEVFFVLFCGIVVDFDLLWIYLFKNQIYHHLLPTHTPIFALGLTIVFYIFLRKIFSWQTFVLAFISMIGHFVLDDLSYWLYVIGIAKIGKPEIFWFFPFDPRRELALESYEAFRYGVWDFARHYIRHPLFYCEVILTAIGFFAFINKTRKYL